LLEADGETRRALAIYAEIGERMIGAEALCRQAAILLSQGRDAEALPLLAEAAKRARQMDRYERARNADMYDWAAEQLSELRAQAGG
jgi:16S rRNA G966 N2-methylase RsmD